MSPFLPSEVSKEPCAQSGPAPAVAQAPVKSRSRTGVPQCPRDDSSIAPRRDGDLMEGVEGEGRGEGQDDVSMPAKPPREREFEERRAGRRLFDDVGGAGAPLRGADGGNVSRQEGARQLGSL